MLAHGGERKMLLPACTLWQTNQKILAFLSLIPIGFAFSWAEMAWELCSQLLLTTNDVVWP